MFVIEKTPLGVCIDVANGRNFRIAKEAGEIRVYEYTLAGEYVAEDEDEPIMSDRAWDTLVRMDQSPNDTARILKDAGLQGAAFELSNGVPVPSEFAGVELVKQAVQTNSRLVY